jgi:dolichol kinase
MTSGPFTIASAVFWVIILALIFSLVRPGSKAGTALVVVTDALAAVIGQVTGYAQRG